MPKSTKSPLLKGSLDLLILQTLRQGAMHGYAITRNLRKSSKEFFQVEEGSLYPALHRMERKGWIASHWGTSESNRRAKFYTLTSDGKKQLTAEKAAWKKVSTAINRVLEFQP